MHSDLSNCICFNVHPGLNLVSQLNLYSDKIPYHSVQELLYMSHVMIQTSTTESCASNVEVKKVNDIKYNFRNIANSFLSNDLLLNDFENIIAHFL